MREIERRVGNKYWRNPETGIYLPARTSSKERRSQKNLVLKSSRQLRRKALLPLIIPLWGRRNIPRSQLRRRRLIRIPIIPMLLLRMAMLLRISRIRLLVIIITQWRTLLIQIRCLIRALVLIRRCRTILTSSECRHVL